MSEGISSQLTRACWARSRGGELRGLLARAVASPMSWQGIAWTTAGVQSVFSVCADSLITRLEGRERPVPWDGIYELRLWAVRGRPDGVPASELRWLNGSGSAGITVYAGPSAVPQGVEAAECWVRPNSYLEHGAEPPFQPSTVMTSLEVFTVEPQFGNTVFSDELMTGSWD